MHAPSPAPGGLRDGLAFATCTMIWGSTFLVIRIGNETVPPMWAATLRLAVAALVLVALVSALGRRLPGGAALRAAAGYGLFQFGINLPLLYWGELVVPSGLAAVVFATIPISSALIARAVGLERLQALKMAGALVALGGVAVLFLEQLGARVTALPLLAIYLATVCSALGSIVLKRGPRQDPLAANAVAAAVGAPVCLLASVLLAEERRWPAAPAQFLPILYLSLVGSVVAYVLFTWLLHRWRVTTVAFMGVVVPVIAVALGAWVRAEPFRREHLLGSALVLTGVGLAVASDRRTARAPATAN